MFVKRNKKKIILPLLDEKLINLLTFLFLVLPTAVFRIRSDPYHLAGSGSTSGTLIRIHLKKFKFVRFKVGYKVGSGFGPGPVFPKADLRIRIRIHIKMIQSTESPRELMYYGRHSYILSRPELDLILIFSLIYSP